MIAVNGNLLWQDVYRDTDGYLFVKDEDGTQAFIGKQKVYYSEEELQERIEAAVKEDIRSDINVLSDNYTKALAHRDELYAKIKLLETDKQEADELNEHLRDKLKRVEAERQPVEVSQELADAIDFLKSKGWRSENIIFHSAWNDTVEPRDFNVFNDEEKLTKNSCNLINKTMWQPSSENPPNLFHALMYGYYVKPDPLRSTISAIWQEYEDGHITQTEALDKITEVAKAHSRTKEKEESK